MVQTRDLTLGWQNESGVTTLRTNPNRPSIESLRVKAEIAEKVERDLHARNKAIRRQKKKKAPRKQHKLSPKLKHPRCECGGRNDSYIKDWVMCNKCGAKKLIKQLSEKSCR